MIIVVTGGREYNDQSEMERVLNEFHKHWPIDIIIHGNARGLDKMAGKWAESLGIQTAICPALWDFYPKHIAGPKRNKMMRLLAPDCCIAFPGGTGTANMMTGCDRDGIMVLKSSDVDTFKDIVWKNNDLLY